MTRPFRDTAHIVRRVADDRGSHVEPPMNDSWSNLDKLRWHAAVVALDTATDITVMDSETSVKEWGRWRRIPGLYDIMVPGCTSGGIDYHAAWSWLNGYAIGCAR